jgi:hypothetical protein
MLIAATLKEAMYVNAFLVSMVMDSCVMMTTNVILKPTHATQTLLVRTDSVVTHVTAMKVSMAMVFHAQILMIVW